MIGGGDESREGDAPRAEPTESVRLESEEQFRALVTASSGVLYRMSADWSEMRQLSGGGFLPDTPSPQRDWIEGYIPADERPRVQAAIDEAVRDKKLFELEHRVRRKDGSTGWVLSRAVPLVDPRNNITEWIGAASDITARKTMEESLRESEVRSRGLIEAYAQATWEADAAGVVVADSPSWRDYTGQTFEEWIGYGWTNAIYPEDREYGERQWREAVAAGRDVDAEFRLHHARSGGYRWTNMRAKPLIGDDGAIRKWIGMNIDIHDRKSSQDALRESEERLALVFDILPVGVGVMNGQGVMNLCNREMQRYLPTSIVPSRDAERMNRWRAQYSDGRAVSPQDFPAARALRGESVLPGLEMRYTEDDGHEIWTRVAAVPIRSGSGSVKGALAVVTDVTLLKTSLRHQQLLLAELQHRVRNTLAVIRSIVRRTAETSESVDDFASHLDGRIGAFSRVQAGVTRDPLAGFDLAELVSDELCACAAREGEQFTLDGPPVRLKPKAAENIGLAIHELATNAVKHGAFTVDGGRIHVRWWKEQKGNDVWLTLDWKESGMKGRRVEQQRDGFGTVLLQETLQYDLAAQVKRLFEPSGFRCEIAFPLAANAS